MRNKKSVLMTGIVNYECFNGAGSAIAGNVRVLGEVAFVRLPCALGSHFAKHLLCPVLFVKRINFNQMNKEQSEQLKQLILNEMAFRKEFRAKRQELENLVDPITKHVKECRKWWEKNLPNALEVVVIMDNGTSLKLVKPKDEVCSVQSYLPFGVDYEECQVIDVGQ